MATPKLSACNGQFTYTQGSRYMGDGRRVVSPFPMIAPFPKSKMIKNKSFMINLVYERLSLNDYPMMVHLWKTTS